MFPYSIQQSLLELKGRAEERSQQDEGALPPTALPVQLQLGPCSGQLRRTSGTVTASPGTAGVRHASSLTADDHRNWQKRPFKVLQVLL